MGRNGLGGSGRGTPSVKSTGHGRILVVAASPINRIVISRMVERVYLKAIAVAPEAALDALATKSPALVIVDGGGNGDLDGLMSSIISQRQAQAKDLPRIVLIIEPSQQESLSYEGVVDAVVAKPITPEALQPVVERLTRDAI